MKPKAPLRHFLALAGSSLLAVSYSHAATRNWDGDTSASWSDAGNWDTAPANSLTTDIANFNLATYGGNPVFAPNAGTTSINGITIGSSNGAMTLTTTNLSIGASGISIANGAGAFTTSGNVTLGGVNQSWLNHSSNLFSVGGGTLALTNRTLTLGGTGDTSISSIISSTNTSGRLVKSGTGTLTLVADNTYTGTTTVSGGELILDYSTNNGSKLADTAALTLTGGSIVLKGGSHTELVSSTTLSEYFVNSISRDGGSAKISLGALAISGARNNAALAISEDNLATTTTANASGILLQGRVTVGSHFGANDGSNNIVAYSGYTTATTAGGGALTVVNQLTGGGTMAADLDSYALRIVNSGNSDVLDLGSNNLEMTNNGSLLYAGGGDNNYTINGTGWVGVDGFGQTFNLNVVDGATLTLNAEVGRNRPKFLKSGAGTLVFGGDNSLLDAYVMEGVLRVTNSGGLGDTTQTTVQSGAALELANDISIGAEPLNLDGHGISNGGALRNQAGDNSFAGAITIGTSGARINADASTSLELTGGIVTAASRDVTIGGAGDTTVSTTGISGAGNLIKDGNGTLTLSGANTYSGTTTVTGGTLLISNTTGSGTGTGTVSVGADGTLGGSGIISGDTTISGIHSPGNSPGIITHENNLTYTSGASVLWELAANSVGTRGTDFDGINVGGDLNFTADTSIDLSFNVSGSTVDWTNAFWQDSYLGTDGWLIYDVAGTTTGLSNLTLNTINWLDSDGQAFNDNPTGSFSLFQSGDDIYLNYAAIPEPSTVLFGVLGTLALLRRRR